MIYHIHNICICIYVHYSIIHGTRGISPVTVLSPTCSPVTRHSDPQYTMCSGKNTEMFNAGVPNLFYSTVHLIL